MLTRLAVIPAVMLVTLPAVAQKAAPDDLPVDAAPPPQVVERGPHHRVWQRESVQRLVDGRSITNRHAVVELESGMHYLRDGEWVESSEEIEIFQGAAVARQGQHQVIFAANFNSAGAIDLQAPDGGRFRSHVLGLVYTDYTSGKSVMIAQTKDSNGQVSPPNQVIYEDAFDGDFIADARYSYTKGGFEQDIILRTTPPSPADWGLNPETTRLEVFTEFLEAPEATVTEVMVKAQADAVARQTMKEPDLVDQRLDFGGMSIGPGQAFPLGDRVDTFSDSAVPTGKSLEWIEGRLILIEKVDYLSVRDELGKLPKSAAVKPRKIGLPDPGQTQQALMLPRRPSVTTERWRNGQYAKVDTTRKGFVLDYVTVNSSLTNFVFRGGTTYLATNTVSFYGTTVLEGSTVIKFATNGLFYIWGGVDCRTAPYRPATFTSKDDNTIGEVIPGSTGNPGLPAVHSFYCRDTTTTYDLHDLRVFYAQYGITALGSVKLNLSNIQIAKSTRGVALSQASVATCRNFLFTDLTYGFYLAGTTTNSSEHGTMHRVSYYRSSTNGLFTLTNSLLISVTNNIVLHQRANVVTNVNDSGYFETVGAGAHYLVSGSTNRDAGTTNIDPALLASLKTRTTYPPTVYSNFNLTTNLTLTMRPIRDTNAPDLGYHYETLDAVFGDVRVTNSTLTVSSGVAVGTFSPHQYGIGLLGGAQLLGEGSPTNLIRIARYNMVQEQATTNWNDLSSAGASVMTKWATGGTAPYLKLRFTEWSVPPECYHFWGMTEDAGSHTFLDNQFFSGLWVSDRPSASFTNNLFHRTVLGLYENYDFTFHMRNSTMVGGKLDLYHVGAGSWSFKDNLFDATTNVYQEGVIVHDYNAYTTNAVRLTNNGAHDVVLTFTNVTYDRFGSGWFYLPTNLTSQSPLFDRGSTNASAVGLYHYTTTTNQVKEGTSTNDIGFHYVALNSAGMPVDSDGDGLPDYYEDTNGNGVVDGTENNFAIPVITLTNNMTYIKGSSAKRFDTNAIAYDADSANLGGAKLTVSITSGGESTDRLAVRNVGPNGGQIAFTGTNISYGGVIIATNSGGTGTTPQVITFNTNAVNTSLQALVRHLTFQNIGNPANSSRVIKFELIDPLGSTNVTTTQTVNIVCADSIDAMIVFDISDSMVGVFTNGVRASNDMTKFWVEKAAASNFVSMLQFPGDRAGLVTFSYNANLILGLTNNGAVVQSTIYGLTTNAGTVLETPINLARTNYPATGSNTLRLMVVVSDGEEQSYYYRSNTIVASAAAKDQDIRIISIGYYSGENIYKDPGDWGTNLLKEIASSAADFYLAPSYSDIQSNFALLAQARCQNIAPTVTITSPTNGASYPAPLNTTITIDAFDDGSVTNVALYLGTTNVANFTSAPYAYSWTNVLGGTYQLKAVAKDNTGLSATSAIVNVTVVKQPPAISLISPTNATHFAPVMNLLVRAAATDVDGYITNVVFYANNVAAKTNSSPPFVFAWTNLQSGSYQVYAKAWDNDNQTKISETNTFVVDTCSQVGGTLLTLSPSTVTGGSNSTATVTLTGNAPSGGQMVSLLNTNPNVSIPASVLVPAGSNQVTFAVNTYSLGANSAATLKAITQISTNTATLTVQSLGLPVSRYAGECGPMDVAFAIDLSGSMIPALTSIKSAVSNVVGTINFASGGDYRLSLVTFNSVLCGPDTEGEKVKIDMTFGTNVAQFSTALTGLITGMSGGTAEASDEALRTIITGVNSTNSTGHVMQCNSFSVPFRPQARKVIVLFTDATPSGTNDTYVSGETEIRSHALAILAAQNGIRIYPVQTWPYCSASTDDASVAMRIMQDYAAVTGGEYFLADSCSDVSVALDNIMSQCGADYGQVVTVRDDLNSQGHQAVKLDNGGRFAESIGPALFDLAGVNGPVAGANITRSGQLRINYGSRFDLGLGAASFIDTNLQSFASSTFAVQLAPLGSAYVTNWHLPFTFYNDVAGYLGSVYPLALMDRVSSICGNNFEVVDAPQIDWPVAKNVLTVKTLSGFQIAQGRCRDFVLTGTNGPTSCQWEIQLYGDVIARSCQPSSWSVDADRSVYNGFNISVPSDAVTSKSYEVRIRDALGTNHSGYFEVLPSGAQNTAPVLLPLSLSARDSTTNEVVDLTIALDAPAEGDGAYVSLTSSNLAPGAIPPYVLIPAGQRSTVVSFRASTTASSYNVVASFNGQRSIGGTVIASANTSGSVTNVTAVAQEGRILLSWDAYPGALSYRIINNITSTLLADHYPGTCLVTTNTAVGVSHCFEVYALTPSGLSSPGSVCKTTISGVLRPQIKPGGGRFNDSVDVSISCETTNATIYWSTNGVVGSLTNGTSYTNSIPLDHSAVVSARAYLGGIWSPEVQATFYVAQATVITCGVPVTATLAITNQPSVYKGSGFYGARYSFEGRRGDVVNISVTSTNFDPDLNLTDPSKQLVVQGGYPATLLNKYSPSLVHTLRTTGIYVIEVTSARQFATGDFSLHLDCNSSPELDVFFGSTNVVNGSSYDLGLVSTGTTKQVTFVLTNSGSDTLNFNNISLTPTGKFTHDQPSLTSISTNSAVSLTVTFHATNTGPVTGTLVLPNDDDFDDTPTDYEFDDPFVLTFNAFVNPPGTAPSVSLTNLSNGQVLTTPPTITLNANASASVTQVLFQATGPMGTIPIGIDTASPWQVNWSNAPAGSYSLKAIAIDNGGRMTISSAFSVIVNNPPVAVKDRFSVFTGSVGNFLDLLANDTDANGNALTITNVLFTGPSHGSAPVSGSGVFYTPTSGYTGYDSFSYLVYDSLGARATGTVSVAIFPQFEQSAIPVATISSPSNNVEVDDPVTFIGTASHQFLQFWDLQWRRRGSAATPWKTFAEGSDAVTNGTLGVFDTTGLANGIYQVKLKVVAWTDIAAETTITLRIGESAKVGQFTLAFTDLQIPVSGLPITLTRSYDSRNTDSGDFGAGWNLDVSSVRLEKSGVMGQGWGFQTNLVTICAVETEEHVVTITFPDDKVFRFAAYVELNDLGSSCTGVGGVSGAYGKILFQPLPGTTGTLTNLHAPAKLLLNYLSSDGSVSFHEDDDDPGNQAIFGPVYDPMEFEFTTLDGRKFLFNAAGKVTEMWDRVGNSLKFRHDGIIHSSGKSVLFNRDSAGRITEIYDPNGLDASGNPSGPEALSYKYDSAGNLVYVHRLTTRVATDPKYVTTQFGYENSKYPHYITSIIDPRGVTGIRNEYGDDGKLKSATDASGKTITYIHGVSNKTEIIVDRLGRTNSFVYDAKGNVTASTNALGFVNSYTFDSNNNKTSEIIAGVLTNSFVYDGHNLLTENVMGGLITNKFTYNQYGQVLASLDGLGQGSTNFYDALGNLLATTNALGYTNGFTYDSAGNMRTLRDALGVLTSQFYDQYGNLTNVVTSKGSLFVTNSYTYDANGNRLTERTWRTQPNGQLQELLTTMIYDAQNRVIATVNTVGQTNQTVLNEIGKQEEVIDKLGRTNRYDYDLRGNLSLVTHADGTTESYLYDAEGRRTNTVDRAGRVTTSIYDALGRLTQTIYPDNSTTQTGYDPAGRVLWTVDARGYSTWFAYDAAGRRTFTTNALGEVTRNQYDLAGNLTNVTMALGKLNRTTTYSYDALNRRVQTTFEDNTTQTTLYDANGQRVGEVDQAGVTTRFGYDDLGRLVAVTNAWSTPSATWATYAYDENGRQTNQVDALGRKTIFQFDSLGQRVGRILPGGQVERFQYDAGGNLLRQTNFNGQIITNLYDSMNRLVGRWHGSTNLELYTYSITGQRAIMSNQAGIVTFAYDKRDRLITNTTPVSTLIYAYDANGNQTNIVSTTANGVSIGYSYDALNRLTNVVDNRLNLTNKNTTYTFDAVGNLRGLNYPNGVTNDWQYDRLNRLTNEVWKLTNTTLASFLYTVAPAGNRTALSEVITNSSRSFAWSYDTLYRLTAETITGATPTLTNSYKFDLVGNRTNRTSTFSGTQTTNNFFDVNDWLDVDSTNNNGSAWFDKNGNTRTNGTTSYLYDWANRLTNSTTVTSIAYDASGNRVKKVVGGGTRLFLVSTVNPSGYPQVMEELTVSGGSTNLACAYVYGLDLISQRQPNVTTNFYGYDGLGSVRFLLNLAGGLAATTTFDAWGNLITNTGTITNLYLFAGEQWDTDLGLYYNRARYYSPGAGRFWSMDTFEGSQSDPLSLHKYLYVKGNPINGIDPSGHETLGGLSITMGQALTLGYKAANASANIYFGAKNLISGIGALQRGDSFSGALEVFMGGLNLGAGFLSAFGPVPPPPPGAALAVVSGPGLSATERAILMLNSNPALRDWFVTHVLPQIASSATAAAGYAVNSLADDGEGGGSGGRSADPPNDHHPIPKFLGGDVDQAFAEIPRSTHQEFHRLLAQYLQDSGFARPIGGVNGSARLWAQDFAANPGAQERALIQVLRASRDIDAKFGTSITQKVWENLVTGSYRSIP